MSLLLNTFKFQYQLFLIDISSNKMNKSLGQS